MIPGPLVAAAWWPLSPATVLASAVGLLLIGGMICGLLAIAMGLTEDHGPMLAAGIKTTLGALLLCFASWAMVSHTPPNERGPVDAFAYRHSSELIAGTLVAGLVEVVGGLASWIAALSDPEFMPLPKKGD